MIVIDGKNAILGRLGSYAAKQALKGEEIRIVNCEEIIITGSKKSIAKEFWETKGRVGRGQKGPKISRDIEKMVKRAIRGMLPDHRWGRGKEALERIKVYKGLPKEFENVKKISAGKEKGDKFVRIKEILGE
jgi:large subunit ribosomal protein L13